MLLARLAMSIQLMSWPIRSCASFGAVFATLARRLPAIAVAKLKPIGGALGKPGYTVLAPTAEGRATAVLAKTDRFSMAGAGHGVNFTRPRAVNPLLERFLARALQGAE